MQRRGATNTLIRRLKQTLEARSLENSLRTLQVKEGLIDFCSNDYLGFARSAKLHRLILEPERAENVHNGSTGSRLLSGNSALFEEVEQSIASFHKAQSALIFNSGYDANLGFFSTVPKRGDTILYDELCHASIRDGIRLGLARAYHFRHNDVDDLTPRLKTAKGQVFVAVESIYSMDGDFAPLQALCELCGTYRAYLIVDEAHATGVCGEKGEGRVGELGLEDQVFARLHTFGKALGCHGAAWVIPETVREYLVNFCRAFIYTTALPPHALYVAREAYRQLPAARQERQQLHQLVRSFQNEIKAKSYSGSLIKSDSPIQSLIIPGNNRVREIGSVLEKAGMDVRPILSPTVPKGSERLRICLHTFNTDEDVALLLAALHPHLVNI